MGPILGILSQGCARLNNASQFQESSGHVSNAALMTWDPQLVASILILAASATLQATVGFAAGLIGIPLLLWAGNSLPEAQIMIITAMLPQNAYSLWRLREHTSLKEIAVPASIRLAFLPLGIFGLAWLVQNSSDSIKPLVGGIVLLAVLMQTFNDRPWTSANKWYWVVTAFGASGLLQGLSGMSAPPMLLWLHGQRFAARRARSFLFAIYLTSFVPQLLLMFWTFSSDLLSSMQVAAMSLPLVLVGTYVGLTIGNRFGERWLRPATYALLVWMAFACLLDPWLH